MPAGLRTKFLLSLLFGVAVFAALSVYADVDRLLAALGGFRWELVPFLLALTLLNYALRVVKWHYYLDQIGVTGISIGLSAAVFFAGLAMTLTPAKVGEWLKSYLLRELVGAPLFRTASVVIAERITDGLAMVLLATTGLFAFRVAWQAIGIVLLAAAAVLLFCWARPVADLAFRLVGGIPIAAPVVGPLREFYDGARVLLAPRNLLIGIGIGFISWGAECVAFYLVLTGLAQPGSLELLMQAAFVLAVASLGGSLLLTPGGLGVAEGGITGLLQLLLGMPGEVAVAAALLIRLSTLWFGVVLGLVALFFVTRRLGVPVR